MNRTLLIVFLSVLIGCSENAEYITAEKGPLIESVYASAIVQPVDMYDAYSTKQGIIHQVLVKEGDTVITGQEIAMIATDIPTLDVENARLELREAKEEYSGRASTLTSILDDIEATEKQLRIDSLNYKRQQRLWEQQIGSKAELEATELKYDLTKNQLEQLRTRFLDSKTAIETNYRKAQNLLQKAQTGLDDHVIASRIDGRVYQLMKEEGELILPQEAMARIGRKDRFEIELLIDEVDITKVSIGQKALISLDAYEDTVFSARISEIKPIKDQLTQTFLVLAEFEKLPDVLYAGLSGEANIVVSEKDECMTIPLSYLIDGTNVRTESGMVEVKTGLRNLERVEIIDGIDATTRIRRPEE